VLQPCLYVTGTVLAIVTEADGDYHVRLQLDPIYAQYLVANQQQCAQGVCGLLVVEPVCEHNVTQSDAVATCAADKDPIDISHLAVGQHVWMTGRYVADLDHGGWHELHPLYAFGTI
jgi:hypothetical protein